MLPTVLLGLSSVLAAAYLANLPQLPGPGPLALRGSEVKVTLQGGMSGAEGPAISSAGQDSFYLFLVMMEATAVEGRYLLLASVFSLGFGVALLPVGYVGHQYEPVAWAAGAAAVLASFALPVLIGRRRDRAATWGGLARLFEPIAWDRLNKRMENAELEERIRRLADEVAPVVHHADRGGHRPAASQRTGSEPVSEPR